MQFHDVIREKWPEYLDEMIGMYALVRCEPYLALFVSVHFMSSSSFARGRTSISLFTRATTATSESTILTALC